MLSKRLGYRKKISKKEWMMLEILDMMEERRLAKRYARIPNISKYMPQHKRNKKFVAGE